jgi:di/tricarboxylate transporter
VLSLAGTLALLAPTLRNLPPTAAVTTSVIAVALVQMAFDMPPDLVLLEAVVALIGLKVITLKEALDGFRSEGVVAVGVMCAVAKSVQVTGGLDLIAKHLLGSPGGYETALLRLLVATMALSAFMNNTPVCAMLMPIVRGWAARLGLGSSTLLMPLSFATMLGGTRESTNECRGSARLAYWLGEVCLVACHVPGTLSMIGSSTNIVAANAANKHDPSFTMKVFDISTIGLINAAAGAAYMVAFGRRLLPASTAAAPAPLPAARAAAAAPLAPRAPPPRGALRLWLTLGLITTTMTIASQAPHLLLPVALTCLCLLVRSGCLTLPEAWCAEIRSPRFDLRSGGEGAAGAPR